MAQDADRVLSNAYRDSAVIGCNCGAHLVDLGNCVAIERAGENALSHERLAVALARDVYVPVISCHRATASAAQAGQRVFIFSFSQWQQDHHLARFQVTWTHTRAVFPAAHRRSNPFGITSSPIYKVSSVA